jgi:hypothetical protein
MKRYPFGLFGLLCLLVLVVGWQGGVGNTAVADSLFSTNSTTTTEPPLDLTWQIQTLDGVGDVGSFISMAVQPGTNIPHIAYYSAEQGLKLAARTGNGNCGPQNQWSCTLLAAHLGPGAWVGRYPSLAFNTKGEYGVVYQRLFPSSGNNYRHSVYQTASGITPLTGLYVNHLNGTHNALSYNYQNQAYIWSHQSAGGLYQENKLINFVTPNRDWHSHMFTTSLTSDRNALGQPAVAYAAYENGVLPSIFHAQPQAGGNCHNGTWECTRVSMVGSAPNEPTQTDIGMALYQSKCFFGSLCDIPTSIFSYSIQYGQLQLAEKTGGTTARCYAGDPLNLNPNWRCTAITSVGWSPKGWLGMVNAHWPMGVDVVLWDGRLVVFYQDFNNPLVSKVMMAYKADVPGTGSGCVNNKDWHCVVVDDGARGNGFVSVGFGLQAELLADGRILLAYHDLSNRDLIIAETVVPPTLTYLPFVVR